MVTARYQWNVRKGFALHRKSQRAAKLIPLLAIAFVCWGAYDTITSDRWISGVPLISFGLLLLFGSRPLALWQFSAHSPPITELRIRNDLHV